MKIAHIAPTAALSTPIMQAQMMHLALASQVLKDSKYAEFYRNTTGFVILDVPTSEEKDSWNSYSYSKLCEAIEATQPNEVTLPDIWDASADITVKVAKEASYILPKSGSHGLIGFLAIPRGETWDEYRKCTDELLAIDNVTTLGVVQGSYHKFGMSRRDILGYLVATVKDKNIHLLGENSDLADLQNINITSSVRSMDTAKLVVFGLSHKLATYGNIPTYPHRGEGYFDRKISELDESYISRNIRYWNALAERKVR